MYDDVWQEIVNGHYTKTQAGLSGYKRKQVRGEAYPAIRPAPPSQHTRIHGILYHDIKPSDLQKLDRFEGELYCRKQVNVKLDSGEECAADTYVIRPRFYVLLSEKDWSPEHFEKVGLSQFKKRYSGFYR